MRDDYMTNRKQLFCEKKAAKTSAKHGA